MIFFNSLVCPELLMSIKISFFDIIPRSPCEASLADRLNDGVPTDARVDAMMYGGDGLTYVNGGTFAVDATVIRNFNNQSIGGIKTFTGALVVPNSSSTTAGHTRTSP